MLDSDRLVRLRAEMERPPFHHWLVPEAVTATAGRIEISLPTRPEFCHSTQPAMIHGGVIAALIDIAGHAVVAVEQTHPAPTVSLSIDFLRPASATILTAVAFLRRLGRSVSRSDVEIFTEKTRCAGAGCVRDTRRNGMKAVVIEEFGSPEKAALPMYLRRSRGRGRC